MARTGRLPARRRRVAPAGWQTVTPRIVAANARALVQFLKRVFGATGTYRQSAPTEARIGESVIMISEVGVRPPTPAFLYVYVEDCVGTYRRAVKAGARVLEEPLETPYGDRRCMVEDNWGNIWQIATRKTGKTHAPRAQHAQRGRK